MQLSLSDLKELISSEKKQCAFEIGKSYLIQTVTHYFTGKIRDIKSDFLILDTCAWIADTGRYSQCFKEGFSFNEVEPVPDGTLVNINSIVDASPWSKSLPTEMK